MDNIGKSEINKPILFWKSSAVLLTYLTSVLTGAPNTGLASHRWCHTLGKRSVLQTMWMRVWSKVLIFNFFPNAFDNFEFNEIAGRCSIWQSEHSFFCLEARRNEIWQALLRCLLSLKTNLDLYSLWELYFWPHSREFSMVCSGFQILESPKIEVSEPLKP